MAPFLLRADRPLVIAHRGANLPGSLPPGADILEADIWAYRGRHEVRHLKTMGPLPILWDRWQLAPGWRPRPDVVELFESLPTSVPLLLDLKRAVDVVALASLIERWNDRPIAVCSQYWHHLPAFERLSVSIVYSLANERQLRKLPGALRGRRCDGVSVHVRVLSRRTMEQLRELAPAVLSWPITVWDVPWALVFGVDGLIADDPLSVRTAVDRWAPVHQP